ncbi:hypothetical protein OROMI_030393 [Orobanche minor]
MEDAEGTVPPEDVLDKPDEPSMETPEFGTCYSLALFGTVSDIDAGGKTLELEGSIHGISVMVMVDNGHKATMQFVFNKVKALIYVMRRLFDMYRRT